VSEGSAVDVCYSYTSATHVELCERYGGGVSCDAEAGLR
jgi:hypothetical protein